MLNQSFKYCCLLIAVSILLLPAHLTFSIENTRLFNNIKVKDGLPANEIFTIDQDSTGFIWMGSINGIIRYDGYEMKIFRKDDSRKSALPDNQITSLAHNKALGMWAGSYEGLVFFDTRTNASQLIDLGKSREIRCLLLQGDSLLWVGTSEGLIKLNTQTHSFKIYNEQNSTLGSNIIRSLYVDSEEILWIGTFNGLNALPKEGKMLFFDLKGNYKPELKNNLILDIQPYTKGNDSSLWIGTETGLILFDRLSHQKKVFNSENTGFGNEVVKCIFPIEDGQLYFGTDFGFYFFNSKTGDFQVSLHDPFNNYSLSNNVVWDIFQDNAGIIWLATANGISQLNVNQGMFAFTPVFNKVGDLQVGNQVNDIYSDNDQTLWLATKSGVVAQHKNGTVKTFNNNKNSAYPLVFNNINTISGDNLGRIWIGSAGGINVWDKAQNRMHTITADFNLNRGLRSNYISAFITPPDGSFWVSTWGGGLYKAKGDFSNIDEIYFEYIADFNTNVFSSDRKIWLESKNKIFKVDLSTLQIDELKKLNNYIENKDVNSLLITSSGELWIGLSKHLLKYNTLTEQLSTFEILSGDESYINNLTEDFEGNIWGTTLTSIFRLSPNTNEAETFPMNKGIPLDVFLSQSNSQSRSGEIFFGGNDGFISFNPREIQKNMFCPAIIITGIKINNKPIEKIDELKGQNRSPRLISYHDNIVLKYDQHSISLGFSALHFGNPHRNLYAYMLEGYDKEWNYTTGFQNFANYSNLSPDKYLFKVKGTNNDGVWFENTTELKITVKPPVWASAWAILFYLILFQVVLTMLFITFRNKIRYKAEINAITLEKEKNEELARAKQQFFTNISHEFRTPLNLIMGPVQNVLDNFKLEPNAQTLLQLVSKNARRLLSLVNQLMDIRKIENKTLKLNIEPVEIVSFCKEQFELFHDTAINQQITFRFEAPDTAVSYLTDPAKLESVIQNLLSNAFKFTPQNGTISFKLEFPDDHLIRITIADTGTGMSPEEQAHVFDRFFQGRNSSGSQAGYGIGLNLAKEYCELMNGSIGFESQPGAGTTFTVEIPLNKPLAIQQASDTLIQFSTTSLFNETKSINFIHDDTRATILLVDDHADTIEFIRLSLAGKYNFLSAFNGKEALKLLEKHKIDLIISDVMMPEIDGISLCEKVKTNPKYSKIPVILLTAATLSSQHIKGFRMGADDYMIKPFNTEILEARIESLLFRNRKMEDYIKQQLIFGNLDVEVDSYNEKLLQETILFIYKHLSDPEINVDKMCKSIGVSHSSLYRKIKAQTGLSLNELIRQIKLKKAAQLMKNKQLTIAEIMDETGFTNHSYFAKCFKKEYGLSPREWTEKN